MLRSFFTGGGCIADLKTYCYRFALILIAASSVFHAGTAAFYGSLIDIYTTWQYILGFSICILWIVLSIVLLFEYEPNQSFRSPQFSINFLPFPLCSKGWLGGLAFSFHQRCLSRIHLCGEVKKFALSIDRNLNGAYYDALL
jgi:hypothetical protein